MTLCTTSFLFVSVLVALISAQTTTIAVYTTCKDNVSGCNGVDITTAQYPLCNNCSSFIQCGVNNISVVFTCPSGMLYVAQLGVCQLNSTDSTSNLCSHTQNPTTATTASTTTTGAEGSIPGCISSCGNHTSGLFPSCQGCQFFFACAMTIGTGEMRCIDNREWDNDVQQCVTNSSTCSMLQASE